MVFGLFLFCFRINVFSVTGNCCSGQIGVYISSLCLLLFYKGYRLLFPIFIIIILSYGHSDTTHRYLTNS